MHRNLNPMISGSFRRLVAFLLMSAFCPGGWGVTKAKAEIQLSNPIRGVLDDVSDFVSSQLGPNQVGASYAALINFAGNPDISTATYYVDPGRGAEATLTVGRFSYRHLLHEEEDDWRPFIQAMVPYERLRLQC